MPFRSWAAAVLLLPSVAARADDALWSAVMQLDADAAVQALEAGADPSARRSPPQSDTPLLFVISVGCRDADEAADARRIFDALLAHGADVNAADTNDASPLLHAAEGCDAAMVKALIDRGAKLHARARGGATPMMMAVIYNRVDVVKVLLAAGYDIKNEQIPLDSMLADKPEIKRLLSKGKKKDEPKAATRPATPEPPPTPEKAKGAAGIGD